MLISRMSQPFLWVAHPGIRLFIPELFQAKFRHFGHRRECAMLSSRDVRLRKLNRPKLVA
jgi:hypothetical protein